MSLVAIVGRPNVGKSTLFNRLVGMRQAIVDDTAGVTRDRHYGRSDWCGREFSVVDTGGYTTNVDEDTTLEELASRYGYGVMELKKLNPEIPADGKVRAGSVVKLP